MHSLTTESSCFRAAYCPEQSCAGVPIAQYPGQLLTPEQPNNGYSVADNMPDTETPLLAPDI